MKYIKDGKTYETPIKVDIDGFEIELTSGQLRKLGYKMFDEIINEQSMVLGGLYNVEDAKNEIINSLTFALPEGGEDVGDGVISLPFIFGHKWVAKCNDNVVTYVLVDDENGIGTEGNPIYYTSGGKLIPGAYYIIENDTYVYNGPEGEATNVSDDIAHMTNINGDGGTVTPSDGPNTEEPGEDDGTNEPSGEGDGEGGSGEENGGEDDEPTVLAYTMAETTSIPTLSKTDFNYLWDVKNEMGEDDRVIYVIRHSARGTETGASGALTDEGIALATKLGRALNDGDDHSSDMYGSTDSVRTKQTAYIVADERCQGEYSGYENIPLCPDSVMSDYFTDVTDWTVIQNYYRNNTDYVNTKAVSMCGTLCQYTDHAKFSMFVSHDSLCVPLVEWATNEAIDVKSNDWINFMSGIAIVVHNDNTYEVFPVKVFDDGLSCTDATTSKRKTTGLDAEITRLHGESGGCSSLPAHAWDSNFSDGITDVSNDEYGWYELYNENSKLQAVLREPDTTIARAAFVMEFGDTIDLTDGAYLSVKMKSLTSDPNVSTAIMSGGSVVEWNSGNNPTVRLVDADGNKSSWIDLGDDGIATSSGSTALNSGGCDFTDSDISSYIGSSFDKSHVRAIECSIVIWASKGDKQSNFKKRNKGVEISSVRVSSHVGACV